MKDSNSIWLVVLGAVLALITSFLIEIYKYRRTDSRNQSDFRIFLKLEVKSATDTINKLVENYGTKRYFEFTILAELNTKIQRLDKIRDRIIYITEDTRKEQILNLFNDINLFYSDTYTLEVNAFRAPIPGAAEQGASFPWDHDIFKSQRQMIALRSVDMKRRVQDLITYLED